MVLPRVGPARRAVRYRPRSRRETRLEKPYWTEPRANLGDADRTHVAGVVAAAIVSGGHPDHSLFDNIGAERPWMEAATGCVAEQWRCLRKQAPVDAHAFSRKKNAIPSHSNDGLQERHSAVGARRAVSPVSALAGFRGERFDGAKFD